MIVFVASFRRQLPNRLLTVAAGFVHCVVVDNKGRDNSEVSCSLAAGMYKLLTQR